MVHKLLATFFDMEVQVMECFTCHERMVCYDDINDETQRYDWLKCQKCGSWAEIEYEQHGKIISRVTWKRDK